MTPDPRNPQEEFDGYDEEQDAEIHEVLGGGPTDGVVLTDMKRAKGGEDLEPVPPEAPDSIVSTDDLDADEDPENASSRP